MLERVLRTPAAKPRRRLPFRLGRGRPRPRATQQPVHEDAWLLVPFVVAIVLGLTAWALGARPWPPDWWQQVKGSLLLMRAAMVAMGVFVGQLVAPRVVRFFREWFEVESPELDEERNQLPQRALGVVENIAYPLLMLRPGGDAASAVIAAWLASKVIGNWKGWEESPRWDPHRGRRLLYVFLLANAFQLAWGAVIFGWLNVARGRV
jgi:hypothetical protein